MVQEFSDEGAEEWEEQREEVFEALRSGELQLNRGYAEQIYCLCQPTRKPYVSLQALLQHVKANRR